MSVVYQYANDHWPTNAWDRTSWDVYKNLLEQAAKIDMVMGEPDCVDPEKAAYADAVEAYLERIGV